MATVKKVKSKTNGKEFAAKMIYFDDDTRFAMREFDLMKSGKLGHKGLVQLHEAYMVRKYLILILDLVDGKTLLDQFFRRHSATEEDVIGDTEFCAPEMLTFDPVLPASDMWSVAIITYILLSGVSPFFYEDEAEVLKSVQG